MSALPGSIVVLPDPGPELGIHERPAAGMGIRESESFEPPQRRLDASRRRRAFSDHISDLLAKGPAERPVGSAGPMRAPLHV